MVARRAHNPKVVGSNPAPATNFFQDISLIFYPLPKLIQFYSLLCPYIYSISYLFCNKVMMLNKVILLKSNKKPQ